jgi:hypothetical protein
MKKKKNQILWFMCNDRVQYHTYAYNVALMITVCNGNFINIITIKLLNIDVSNQLYS